MIPPLPLSSPHSKGRRMEVCPLYRSLSLARPLSPPLATSNPPPSASSNQAQHQADNNELGWYCYCCHCYVLTSLSLGLSHSEPGRLVGSARKPAARSVPVRIEVRNQGNKRTWRDTNSSAQRTTGTTAATTTTTTDTCNQESDNSRQY